MEAWAVSDERLRVRRPAAAGTPWSVSLELDSHCIEVAFAGDVPLYALADGTVQRGLDGDRIRVARDGLLAAVPAHDRRGLVTGGEDGRVCLTEASGAVLEIARVPRKWITAVTSGPGGVCAFASGRTVWLRDAAGALRELRQATGVEAVAFAPDGSTLAVARYDAVAIHPLDPRSDAVELPWKGVHSGVTFSPDGRFLLMPMKTPTVHGWRLADAKHFRMIGYPAQVRDWSWSAAGSHLATSGAAAAIVWPFASGDGRALSAGLEEADGAPGDGPMNRIPLELGRRDQSLVTAVACHPASDVVAIGYADGAIHAARIGADGQAILRAPGTGELTSLAWDAGGARLAFGTTHGECGVIAVPGSAG